MCVIAVYEERYPTLEELRSMELVNRDGGGVAWREKGAVCFEKGLKAERIYEIVKDKKLPVVVHFRAATHGGVCPELCHPFPITEKVPLVTKGRAQRVLFHNGVWYDWQKICLNVVVNYRKRFVSGRCSDTRALAWLVACVGESVLTLIGERVVVFTPKQINFYGEGWTREDGVVYSNTYWKFGGFRCTNQEHVGKWGWSFKNKSKTGKGAVCGEKEKANKDIIVDTDPKIIDGFGGLDEWE
jgi:hypothetical protein